jgi:NADPH:quinone reductase-like Zn-dependent oxidoreductase
MSMQAVLIKDGKGPVENIYIGETSIPTLQPGQVLVKVGSISMSYQLNRLQFENR